jgi:hypothetical protein
MQGEGGPLDDLIGHSITYRIAVGPRAGQKLFTLQTVLAREPESEQQGDGRGAANAGGFSLHAGLDIQTHRREIAGPGRAGTRRAQGDHSTCSQSFCVSRAKPSLS